MSMHRRRLGTLISAATAVFSSFLAGSVSADVLIVPDQYPLIQLAIDAAVDGDEVLVRQGTYFETIDFLGKAITVRSEQGPESTRIRASGMNDSVVKFRNGEGRDSVIEGFELREGSGNCDLFFCYGGGVFCNETNPTIRDCIIADNATTFDGGAIYVRNGGLRLEGCRILRNRAEWYNGGGIYARLSEIEVVDCHFEANYGGGGGIYLQDSSAIVTGTSFIANQTAGEGGAIKSDGPVLEVRDCTFEFNISPGAAGAIERRGDITVEDCVFAFNDCHGDGGAMFIKNGVHVVRRCRFTGNTNYGQGGAIKQESDGLLFELSDCRFEDNQATVSEGGGLRTAGSRATVSRCVFERNSAHSGGGIKSVGIVDRFAVVDCLFANNHAVLGTGGGMRCDSGESDIVACRFLGNDTSDTGGGFSCNGADTSLVNCVFSGNRAYWNGGGIDVHQGGNEIVNCTILDNTAYQGGGGIFADRTTTIANSIIRGNHSATHPQIKVDDWQYLPFVVRSNVEGFVPGEFLIDLEPGLADPDGVDSWAGTLDDDLRSTGCMAGIDFGDATLLPPDRLDLDGDGDLAEPIPFDLLGRPRFVDDPGSPDDGVGSFIALDLGAYEHQTTDPPCDSLVDCDGNGVPDSRDIAECDGSTWCLDCNGNGRPDACDLEFQNRPIDVGVAYWRFEEGKGTVTADLAPDGIQGDLVGVASLGDQVPVAVIPGTGLDNLGSLEVGETGFVRVRDPEQRLAMGRTDWTIEAWVRLDELGGMGDASRRQYLLQRKPGDSPARKMDFAILAQCGNLPYNVDRRYGKVDGLTGRELCVQLGNNADSWCVTSNLAIDSTGWHHISASIDGAREVVRFTLDGVIDEVAFEEWGREAFEANVIIGAHQTANGSFNQFLRGAIDELRISRGLVPIEELLPRWPIGTSGDCNGNGRPDDCDIADGLLSDADWDGIPDECGAGGCPADLDGDGVVRGSDLGLLFIAWGQGGAADLDGDGEVGGSDLGLMFVAWGPCPSEPCEGVDCDGEECTIDRCNPVTGDCMRRGLPGCVPDPCRGVFCDDGVSCTVDSCDPITGECVFTPIPGCGPNPCDDLDCDDGNPCTFDTCDPLVGQCRNVPIDGCENAPCGSPDAGSCFRSNPTPNCSDAVCCETVCAFDDYCCTGVWDETCAELAVNLCP
jgi:hypothetical protein